MVTSAQLGAQCTKKRGPFGRIEVADRAAEEGNSAGAVAGQHVELVGEIGPQCADRQLRVLGDQAGAGGPQCVLADIQRDIGTAGPVLGEHRVEEQGRFLRGSGAEFDQCVGARRADDLRGVPGQDRPLGAGRVVLRQPGDVLEQLAAQLVVEPLGRQPFSRGSQAGQHI